MISDRPLFIGTVEESHTAKFDINPGKTALLVIDMQNTWLGAGGPMETPSSRSLVPKLNKLIQGCREKGISIIFTRHAHRSDGSDIGLFAEFIPAMAAKTALIEGTPDVDIYRELEYRQSDILVTKQAYSAFYGTNLDLILRTKGIDTVIISGIVTWGCCESTARDARHRNYKVIFLSDGTGTYGQLPDMGWGVITAEETMRHVLTVMAFRFAQVLSVEQVLVQVAKAQLRL